MTANQKGDAADQTETPKPRILQCGNIWNNSNNQLQLAFKYIWKYLEIFVCSEPSIGPHPTKKGQFRTILTPKKKMVYDPHNTLFCWVHSMY